MTGRSAAGPCGSGGGVCQRHLAARVAARDSPAGEGGRADDVELLILATPCPTRHPMAMRAMRNQDFPARGGRHHGDWVAFRVSLIDL